MPSGTHDGDWETLGRWHGRVCSRIGAKRSLLCFPFESTRPAVVAMAMAVTPMPPRPRLPQAGICGSGGRSCAQRGRARGGAIPMRCAQQHRWQYHTRAPLALGERPALGALGHCGMQIPKQHHPVHSTAHPTSLHRHIPSTIV